MRKDRDQPRDPAREVALDEALAQVVAAAQAHLAAVRAAGGAADDGTLWRSYVALNNASHAYDQLLLDGYGEATPWETEPIDPAGSAAPTLVAGPDRPIGEVPPDPHPGVISVRQRRDYRVPSVSGLLAAARGGPAEPGVPPPAGLADAVLAMVAEGDGTLAGLDLAELELLSGAVTVVEVPGPLPPGTADAALFEVGAGHRQVGRLDEQPSGPGGLAAGGGETQ